MISAITLLVSSLIAISLTITVINYIRNIFISRHWLNSERLISSNHIKNTDARIAIVVPVYREQTTITKSVEFFDNFAKHNSIDIYFVTTDREREASGYTTYDKLKSLSKRYCNIIVINSNNKSGFKAAQVNYALYDYGLANSYKWVGVFDVDSRPDELAITYVKSHCNDTIQVMQMPTVYRPTINNAKANAAALFQNKWSLCFEIPNWIKWNDKRNVDMYLVGHGLFLNTCRPITFDDNSIAEDLDIGYKCSRSGISLRLIPYFDYATVPNNYLSIAKQSSRWYKGELDNVLSPGCNSTAKRKFEVLSWALGVPAILSSLTFLIFHRSYLLATTIILSLFIYAIVIPIIIDNKATNSRTIAWYAIRSLINPIGPLVCIAKNTLGLNAKFNRTEK